VQGLKDLRDVSDYTDGNSVLINSFLIMPNMKAAGQSNMRVCAQGLKVSEGPEPCHRQV